MLLEDAQESRLQGVGHVTDLIEKDGSAVGLLEKTDLSSPLRTGEGAFLIPEQFTFQQTFRKRRTVNCNERTVFPIGRIVDRLGEHFLSGSCLAGDEDCIVTGSRFFCETHEMFHGWISVNNIIESIAGGQALFFQLMAQVAAAFSNLGGSFKGKEVAGGFVHGGEDRLCHHELFSLDYQKIVIEGRGHDRRQYFRRKIVRHGRIAFHGFPDDPFHFHIVVVDLIFSIRHKETGTLQVEDLFHDLI